jgi:hypothetical protein
MRVRVAVLSAVLGCSGVVVGAADAPTERFAVPEGGYVAFFPAGAEVKEKTIDVPGGLKQYLATATVKATQRTFVVSYTPHQKGVLKAPAKATLELGEKAVLSVPKTMLVSSKTFTLGKEKYPARDVLTIRDGNETRTRFIAADPVLYTLVVGGPKEFASGKEAADFFDTFEFTPGKVKAKK